MCGVISQQHLNVRLNLPTMVTFGTDASSCCGEVAVIRGSTVPNFCSVAQVRNFLAPIAKFSGSP